MFYSKPPNTFSWKHGKRKIPFVMLALTVLLLPILIVSSSTRVHAAVDSVTILAPDNGAILFGTVTLQANVVADTPIDSVEFFYDPHEDTDPEVTIGTATFNSTTGFWEMAWDTTTVADTYNIIDTDGDGTEDTLVNITKPPTHDRLRVVATSGASSAEDAIDIRIQNMLTVRFTLPDNQEDMRGFVDLEAVLTSEFDIISVSFDVYDMSSADPAILTPFGEFESLGEPIENRHYGRPLGAPAFPTGSSVYSIGAAAPEGSNTKRWVIRGWDTTMIPDGTWLLVATAEDSGGRTATYMVETYIVNDLRVVITAPGDGATVSRFVPLEARTSSLTGADNAAPGSLWPATAVDFTIDNGIDPAIALPATEIPAGSGRWRAVWDGDASNPGLYTITATATEI